MSWMRRLGLCLIVVVMNGCYLSRDVPVIPDSVPDPMPDVPTNQSQWEVLAPGLERRLYLAEQGLYQILALRIDPAIYTFRAHYRPGEPLRVQQWADALPGVTALINANFFDPQHRALGLLVVDGVAHGQSYGSRGGTFTVQNGVVRVRSNTLEPYAGEPLEQAVQAFPMLVVNGEPAYSSAEDRVTRRTAIGQDGQGRILLVVTPGLGITLTGLSAFLASSDMELVNAFNLDGGGSTMMYIDTANYTLVSRDPVPAVLAIYPR